MRIDNLSIKQQSVLKDFDPDSKACIQLVERLNKRTNDLYRDVCLA